MPALTDAALARLLLLGPGESMRQDERERGNIVIRPGDVPWLPRDDWPDNVVISRAGSRVRIVAIYARQPGNGAFSRMIAGICAAGLVPVVVCPARHMREILTRWRWQEGKDDEWIPAPT